MLAEMSPLWMQKSATTFILNVFCRLRFQQMKNSRVWSQELEKLQKYVVDSICFSFYTCFT